MFLNLVLFTDEACSLSKSPGGVCVFILFIFQVFCSRCGFGCVVLIFFIGFPSLLLIIETLNLKNRFFNEDSAVLRETLMRDALLERRARKGLWVGISSSAALCLLACDPGLRDCCCP